MRKKIYAILESKGYWQEGKDFYDLFMVLTILVSLVPLMFKEDSPFLKGIELATTLIFLLDYLLRWLTADFALKRGPWSFLLYPFGFLAVVDGLSLLSGLAVFNSGWRLLKVFRLARSVRALKLFRYSRNTQLLLLVIKRQRDSLILVGALTIGYIVFLALLIFTLEGDQFASFTDALYWATITLTTIGYGDFVPQTDLGQWLTIVSSIVGVGIVALPAGIITAGYLVEIGHHGEGGEYERENPTSRWL